MKKLFSTILVVAMLVVPCVPAFASTYSSMYSYNFTGLLNNKEYYKGIFYGRDVPTRVMSYTTNLTCTGGTGKTVKMGVANYFPDIDGFNSAQYTEMTFQDYEPYVGLTLSNSSAYCYILQNRTGGTIKGTATWKRMDNMN